MLQKGRLVLAESRTETRPVMTTLEGQSEAGFWNETSRLEVAAAVHSRSLKTCHCLSTSIFTRGMESALGSLTLAVKVRLLLTKPASLSRITRSGTCGKFDGRSATYDHTQ